MLIGIKKKLSKHAPPSNRKLLFQLQYNDQQLPSYIDASRKSDLYDQIVKLLEKIDMPVAKDDQQKGRNVSAKRYK